ncbi:hypothetical protein Pmani_004176 [Petrolisthes manimaculis]|uniref:Uncharacterized protein n=1 Tax=Petrolisthes manimaculis TaxID=1843537 RepID=A0AAE1QEJ9_9EUCA|nr:hypothetical protein Pmani_004176 [Petrolisthes manimaculis]
MWCGHFLLSLAVGISHWHLLQGLPPPPPTSLLSAIAPSSFPSTTANNRRSPRSPPGPCAAKALKAWRRGKEKESRKREIEEGEEQQQQRLSLQYTIEVENPENCLGPPICGDGENMMLRPSCYKRSMLEEKLSPQVNGSVDVCWGDCAELRCGSIKFPYNLPPVLELRGNITLRSPTLMLVPLVEKRLPTWVKNVKVRVVSKGHMAGKLSISQHTSLLEIPGTFGPYKYNIIYQIVSECTGDWWKLFVENITPEVPTEPPPPKTMVLIILGVLVVLVLLVGILTTVLLRRKRRQSQRSRVTQPSFKLHRSKGDILLIHDTDSGAELVSKCNTLKHTLSHYCNREVRDLCNLNDREFVEDPSAWLLNLVTQKEEVTLMLVLTPAITNAIIQLTRQHSNPQKLNVMETLDRGLLINDCLRTLQNEPERYFQRLVLVRLDEGEATDNNDLLPFTLRRPFLLYKEEDQRNLLAALHPDPSHTPTDTTWSTSPLI